MHLNQIINVFVFTHFVCNFFLYVIYINNDLVIIHINSTVDAYQLCVVIYIILYILHKGFVRCAIVLQCYVKVVTICIDQCS